MMKGSTKNILTSLLLTQSLLLLGCGGSNSTSSPVVTNPPPTQPPATTTLSDKLQSIDDYAAQKHSEGLLNGAVLVAKQGEPLLIKTYGYTNFSKTTELTVDSSMRMGSVSKQFTAMAVMILQERGLLDFNDLVSQHIAELDYADITIEHLLHHTSGLSDYLYFPQQYITERGAEFLTMPLFFDIIEQHPLTQEFTPGSEYAYSNTGYILLAEIVARVSGQTFEAFLDEEIFQPLAMSNSGVWNLLSDNNSDRLPNRTQGFYEDMPASPTYFDGVAGDGAVFISIADFLKWDDALTNNTLVSAITKAKAFSPATLIDGSQTNYGYGWMLGQSVDNNYVLHGGLWLAAHTMIVRNTSNNTMVVVLDSSGSQAVSDITQYMLDTLADEGF